MEIVIDKNSIKWHITMEELHAVYNDYNTFKIFVDCVSDVCNRINKRAQIDAIERLCVNNAETKAENNGN